jgi:hypothetical protein
VTILAHSNFQSLSFAVLLGLIVAIPASAGVVYRWLDEQGNTVVSDRQPASGVDFETISTSSGRAMIVPPPETPIKEDPKQPVTDAQPKPAPKSKPPGDAYTPKKDPKLCAQARGNMPILEDGPRIRFTDEKGVVRFMTDEERALEKERTADAITAYCED